MWATLLSVDHYVFSSRSRHTIYQLGSVGALRIGIVELDEVVFGVEVALALIGIVKELRVQDVAYDIAFGIG